MSQPLVSIIIPVFNGEKYLAEAIESVMSQSYENKEIIVIDDGSTDSTYDIVKKYAPQIIYHYQENAGTGAARNKGISVATGEVIAFLDADDIWKPDKLTYQVSFLQTGKEEMVFCKIVQFFSPDMNEEFRARYECNEEPMDGLIPSAFVARSAVFSRVGFFVTDVTLGEFIDWYSKAKECGLKTVVHPEVLAMRRIHSSNIGIVERDNRLNYLKILKASLDRRRADNE